MIVADIMRTDVVTLDAGQPLAAAWRCMREQRLAALPVIDTAGRLLGMLGEDDLLARLAPRPRRGWWTGMFDDKDRLAAEYVKSVGLTVGHIMTLAPATIPDATVAAAAGVMRRHGLDVLPVVANEACIGVVTRADVLDHLSWPDDAASDAVTDAELERAMHEGLQHELWVSRYRVGVEAVRGVIRLSGAVATVEERAALVAMARSRPGCVGVEDRLADLSASGRRGVVFA